MKYFGTDGIRGEVSTIFTLDFLIKVGKAISKVAIDEEITKICIGYDPRISSSYINSVLIGIFLSSGIEVIDLGEISTPVVSYTIINNEDIEIGIMISASHNKYTDNGIKIFGPDGKKLNEHLEERIESQIGNDIQFNLEKLGKKIDGVNYLTDYMEYIENLGCDFSDCKVVLDLANGSATHIAPKIFTDLGAQVYLIGDKPDGYNINQKVGSTKIDTLSEYIQKTDADLGFAYDGDADRVILVNKKGDILDGDYIIYLLAKYLKEKKELNKDNVVITLMANLGLKESLNKLNIDYKESAVGDKYVMRMLDEWELTLGGEQSGHIILPKLLPTGDGILVSVVLTKIILQQKIDLIKLVDEMPKYPQKLINVKVKDKNLIMNNKDFLEDIEKENQTLKDFGRILVRASGTENLIRIMVENRSLEVCEETCNSILKKMEKIK